MRTKIESWDIFALVHKLEGAGVNPRFLKAVREEFETIHTLTPESLYQLRRVAYAKLKVWFEPDWAKGIYQIQPPVPKPLKRIKGIHIFYERPGRKSKSTEY
jgi:hypothetical protein